MNNINRIIEEVCRDSTFITDLHYDILGKVIQRTDVDEEDTILHELKDIIDNYLEGN